MLTVTFVFTANTTTRLQDGHVLIVVPTTLLSQWYEELQRWCQYGAIEILPYTGQYNKQKRTAWWEAMHKSSNASGRAKVILTTQAVCSLSSGQIIC
jgi:SNF2 family DNA or RNA helicase